MKQTNKIFIVIAMLLLVLLTAKAAWGAVVINEVMPDPKTVLDSNGEYFELYNSGDEDVNIGGWAIKDNGGESHTINGVLTIPAEGYLMLCRNADKTINGGIDCDYEYTSFTLGNSDDEIILTDVDEEEQDKVEYTTAFPFATGASMELKAPSLDNNVVASWKQATSNYNSDNKGTPGKANNDAPVISVLPATLNAVEGVKFSYTVTATDDGEQKDLFVSAANSILPTWLTIDPNNKLTLTGTPQTEDVVTIPITLVVSDGSALSEKKTADLTVKPALEISEVKVKGAVVVENTGETLPITPGEDYSVEFKVTNNFDSPISLIMSKLTDVDNDDGLGFADQKEVFLGAGEDKVIVLSETMPNLPNAGKYNVEITTTALGFWKAYGDSFPFSLVVEKPVASVKINEIAWNGLKEGETAKTYCNQILDLNVDFENLGGVEAKSMKVSVLDSSGKVVSDSGNSIDNLASGEEDSTTLFIDLKKLTDLSYGNTNQLSVKLEYTVNGFKMAAEALSPNPAFIPMDCFAPTTPVLIIYEEESGEKDLKEFTPSTKLETPESVTYALKTQTNPELVDCTLDGAGKFQCNSKIDDVSGESVFDITLTSGTTVNDEKITVKVNPTIDITGVKVKSKAVEKDKESTGIKSLEEFPLDITLTNSWKSAIKNVKFSFGASGAALGLEDKEFSGESIAPGSSKTFSLTQKLANTAAGTPSVTITVTAEDENFKEVDDTFGFKLNVGKETGELKITKLEFKDFDNDGKANTETYCNPQLTLLVSYVNSGKEDIDDIIITIKDENGDPVGDAKSLLDKESPSESGDPEYTEYININTIEMSAEEHTLSVTFTYTYDGKEKSDSATIKLTKQDCLNIPADKLTITEDDSGIDLDLKDFLVGKEDQEDAQNGGLKFNLEVTNQSNKDLISCNIVKGASILHCDWPFGKVPPDNALAQSLKDGESKTNEVEITMDFDGASEITNKEKFTITVNGKNDAPKFFKEVAINFEEDETKSVKLSDYVKDADNPASELTIKASGNEKVTVTKDGENLIFSAEKDWNGKEEFELTVTDPAGLSETKKILVLVTSVDDTADISDVVFDETNTTSGEAVGPITENENYELSIGINNPDGTEKSVKWYVDGVYKETDKSTKTKFNAKYTFNAKGKVDKFIVKAVLTDKAGKELGSKEWVITTTDKPLDLAQFGVDGAGITNVNSVKDLTLKNSYGEIKFKNNVDLSSVAKLSDVVKLEDKLVAIDSSKASGINKPATITLYNTGLTNPVIKKTTKFTSDKTQATEITSIKPTVSGGTITFEVNSFSTYVVVENVPAALEVSAINVDSVERNTTINTTFTIKNIGSLNALTNLKAELVNVDAKYAATLSAVPTTLAPGGEPVTVTLTLTIPKEESSGSHSIGSVKVSSNEDTETVAINLNPKSALTIESVEVNGKKNGELSLEKENEFEVRVQNDYTKDMEDVTVTVTILDVDGDDLDEEADSFDLDTGDDDVASVKFDLSNENVDENEYTLEILVEGDADDDSTHETLTTMKVKVDRQKHQVLLNEVKASSTILECNRQTSLDVELKNIGKSNEDDVQVKVKNTALGMDLVRDNIELDDYSGNDNTYDASFNLNLEGAAAGTYPITVEMYLNGKLEETDSVSIEVKECLITSTVTQQQPSYSAEDVAQQMQQQLQQQLLAKKQAEQAQAVTKTATEVSFRDTPEYTLMLGALVMLGFIAIILAFAVLMKGGKRKVE